MYSFTEVLKVASWYAFGITPKEVATRLGSILEDALKAIITDFKRFDGHVSEVLRYLERRVFINAFCPRYTDEIDELLRSQQNLRSFMPEHDGEAESYESLLARLSGSPETAPFNSVDNAFIAYVALRKSRGPTGHYLTPVEAYRKLGLYGGDDGVTPNVSPKLYVEAASQCGQVITINAVARHGFGITFLSRIYGPDVWTGDINSVTDLPRTLSKFHVTAHMPPNITPLIKLREKCFAYWLTDENTPVLGEFVKRFLQLDNINTQSFNFQNLLGNWNARYPKTEQYPNDEQSWMRNYANSCLSGFEFVEFSKYLLEAKTPEHLLTVPICHLPIQPTTTVPVVVDDDVLLPDNTQSIIAPQNKAKSHSRPPRLDTETARSRSRGRRSRKVPNPKIESSQFSLSNRTTPRRKPKEGCV